MRYAQTNLQLYAQLLDLAWAPTAIARVHRAHALARLLFTAQYRASGKPFLAHLVGTASILAAHGADADTVGAGLLHAAYAQGDFGRGPPGAPAHRRRVRAAVGPEVEALVHAYAAFRWENAGADRRVLLLRLANELEEGLDLGILHAGDGKRARATEALEKALGAAEEHGFMALAKELRGSRDRLCTASVPAELREAADGSFTVAALSHRRGVLAAADRRLRRLGRLLRRGPSAASWNKPGAPFRAPEPRE